MNNRLKARQIPPSTAWNYALIGTVIGVVILLILALIIFPGALNYNAMVTPTQ